MAALYNAAIGHMTKGYAFAGSNAYLAEKIRSVKEVIHTLKKDFFQLLTVWPEKEGILTKSSPLQTGMKHLYNCCFLYSKNNRYDI